MTETLNLSVGHKPYPRGFVPMQFPYGNCFKPDTYYSNNPCGLTRDIAYRTNIAYLVEIHANIDCLGFHTAPKIGYTK
jgi:hypothetical protein